MKKKGMASEGGKARARSLRPEDRREIARYAAEKRWAGKSGATPAETHPGILRLGGVDIECAVLDNNLRVLSIRGVTRAFGGRTTGTPKTGARQIPPFLASNAFKDLIPNSLMARVTSPVEYRPKRGGRTAFGYEAEILSDLCELVLEAKKKGRLKPNQEHFAVAAQTLLLGFAKVGIIALVDEATGYQYYRARDDLNKILEAYLVPKELMPWTKRFPDEFFRQIYRLQGWEYREGHHKHTPYLGKLINKHIYRRLPEGVLPELQRRNPPTEKGWRRHKHHQFLTPDIGNPHLERQLVAAITLARVSKDTAEFEALMDKAFPKPPKLKNPNQLRLGFEDRES